MKSIDRQLRIGLLSRQTRGEAVMPRFLSDLSIACKARIDVGNLTDLPERDRLIGLVRAGYRQLAACEVKGYRRMFAAGEADLLFANIEASLGDLGETAILLPKLSQYCGGVKLPGAVVFRRVAEILVYDSDGLTVVSEDGTQGCLVDHSPDDKVAAFELGVWGDRWSAFFFNGPCQIPSVNSWPAPGSGFKIAVT